MTTRRQFMHSSLGLVVPLLITRERYAAGARNVCLRVERFVFDNRFADAVALARAAFRAGIPADEISGDLTELWYEHLDLAWRSAPSVVAGATTWRGLFVLRTLAADRGMRVVYSGEYRTRDDYVTHRLSGPEDLITTVGATRRQAFWELLGAAATAQSPLGKNTPATAKFGMPVMAAAAARKDPLFTWVLAPRNCCVAMARVGVPS